MFPRYRFNNRITSDVSKGPAGEQNEETTKSSNYKENEKVATASVASGEIADVDMPRRTYLQKLALIHYYKDDQTTWFQYFRRPFFLFAFPNIVLAGIQFAFGCTAGIVSFNTISEIMTGPPYNWTPGPAGLIFLAALVGNFFG